jgi:hypothetical protein
LLGRKNAASNFSAGEAKGYTNGLEVKMQKKNVMTWQSYTIKKENRAFKEVSFQGF